MLHIALYQPEIPPNTGNIIRLCANSGARLHLIHPLGFDLNEKSARRAGLDYHEYASIKEYQDYDTFLAENQFHAIYACETSGSIHYTDAKFSDNDCLLFGPETRGLPDDILNATNTTQIIRIPMLPTSRSINLSNSVAVISYEALRQTGFQGLD